MHNNLYAKSVPTQNVHINHPIIAKMHTFKYNRTIAKMHTF